jgi:hypothetical protein
MPKEVSFSADPAHGRPAASRRLTLRGLSQFAFQDLNIDAFARTTGRQLAVNHDRRNGSNAELLGSREAPSVHHIAHDDFGRRTGL